MSVHQLRIGMDVALHLLHQHNWLEYAGMPPEQLLEIHRELHEIERIDRESRPQMTIEMREKGR